MGGKFSHLSCTKRRKVIDLKMHERVDNPRDQIRAKKPRDYLQKENDNLILAITKCTEKMDGTEIFKDCGNVIVGNKNIMTVENTIDMETDKAADNYAELKYTNLRLQEMLDSVQKKLNMMEAHFSDLTQTLTRDHADVAQQLICHNQDIADKFEEMKIIFQRLRMVQYDDEEERYRIIEKGVKSIQEYTGLTSDVTFNTLPVKAMPLHKMLNTSGIIPVELEKLLRSTRKGYYTSDQTFDDNVARWLVEWVRKNANRTNMVALLDKQLKQLDQYICHDRSKD